MKKLYKILILSVCLVTLLMCNNLSTKEIKQVIINSNDNYYIEDGEKIIEFTDNSYIIIDSNGNVME